MFRRAVLFVMFVRLSSSLRVLTEPPLNCTQPGLRCKVETSNCMDPGWLRVNKYTPGSPEELEVDVDIREDQESGRLQAVLLARWKLRDEGSICHLTATELHVLDKATNKNVCVRYSFSDQLPMRNPQSRKWSFSADMLVLDPGEYLVSVFNIPKPEQGHSSYDVCKDLVVEDCHHPKMRRTWFCIQRGSLWKPNISLSVTSVERGPPELRVSFDADALCDSYIVVLLCGSGQDSRRVIRGNHTTLQASFSLSICPRSICQIEVSLKPLFPSCGQDCRRHRSKLDLCLKPTVDPPDPSVYKFIVAGLVVGVVCVAVVIAIFISCPRKGNHSEAALTAFEEKPIGRTLKEAPKVLVIYSQDHSLYRDIVLKLCAFLQAKCGTQVLVDLLDTTSVGLVGRLRWLEWQRQQMKNPSDKVLVLCSRGVQAKWKAMCGCGRVTLREDLLSPTDDMLTPFLNLFLPDMHQAGMQGKYMVAYFEDVCSEQDVPSVFDISVKYRLMKHFEDLYFRILDLEKYQPHQVNHIQGIGGEEYFLCPSGEALCRAINTFRVYQTAHPDWFEQECVSSEEEVLTAANQLIDHHHILPVLECLPVITEGLPVFHNVVEICQTDNRVQVVTPEISLDGQRSSLAEVLVNPSCDSNLARGFMNQLRPHDWSPTPVPGAPPSSGTPSPYINMNAGPVEHDETDFLLPFGSQLVRSDLPASESDIRIGKEGYGGGPSEGVPEEMDELEALVPEPKGLNSGSDHGYQSKTSSQDVVHLGVDPLAALAQLQEELFLNSLEACDGE